MKIEILSDTKINKDVFKKGDVVEVSKSIRDLKVSDGVAKDYKPTYKSEVKEK